MDNRRFFRQAMMLTLAAGLLASCSKEDNAGAPEPEQDLPIASTIALSRSEGDVEGPVTSFMLEKLPLYFTREDDMGRNNLVYPEEAIRATCSDLQDEIATVNFNPVQYYLRDGNNTQMQGWYPAGVYSLDDEGFPQVEFTFTGKEDIIVSDVLEGNKSDLGLDELFTFSHVLTQLKFQVTAESEIAAQQWGAVTGITIVDESNSYTYYLIDPASGDFGNGGNDIAVLLPQSQVNIVYGSTNASGIAMVEPRTISARNTMKLIVTTTQKGESEEINLNDHISGHEFKEGEAYDLTLNFLQGEITIKLTPADWEAAEGPENVDLAENQPYVISDKNYIVSRNMFGDAEGWTVRDEKWTETPTSENEISVPVILEVETSNLTDDATLDHVGCPEGWRIPTKTELELIAKYKDKLTKEFTGGDGSSEPLAIKGTYWSGTEDASGARYYVDMETGESGTATEGDGQTHHVRCVRDVEM